MAIVTMPAASVPADVEWRPGPKTQVNRSEWTGRAKTTVLAGAPRWKATVKLPPILGEPNVYAWRAFVVDLEGQANSFRLIACERDQLVGVTPLVNGAGQGGYTLATDGWGAAGTKLKRGQFVTIGDQLLALMADVVANGSGQATLTFKPYIRVVPADNAPIEVRRPWALMKMVDDDAGWAAHIGQNYEIGFQCEEAY